jgi:hypothetical protein
MERMGELLKKEHVIFPLGWDDLGTRKTAFADVFLSLLEKRGFKNAQSLKIRGAYAFTVEAPDGSTTRIGLKSAYNGWLNTAHKMVEAVDTVWVMSFRWTGETPGSLDLHEIAADDLLDFYKRIHKRRATLGRQSDHTYVPVLHSTLKEFTADYPNHYACSEGALEDHAKLIYTAPLVWSNSKRPGIVSSADTQKEIVVAADPLQGVEDPIAALKQLIAKRNNTTVDKVKVLIEA